MKNLSGHGVGGAAQPQTCGGTGSSPVALTNSEKKGLRLKLRKLDRRIALIDVALRLQLYEHKIEDLILLRGLKDRDRRITRQKLKKYVPK